MKGFAMAACALSVAANAWAQAPQPVPAFKAGVELVRLDVQITDADGRPIPDVKPEELELLESGARRPIILFQHVEEPIERHADIERRTVTGDVSTNQGAARGHLYVFVFDQQHIAPGHEQQARIAAERFLRSRLRPNDRAAVYLLPGPGLQSNFTAHVDRLVAALRSVRGLAEPIEYAPAGTMTLQEAFQVARGDELTLRRVSDRIKTETAQSDVSGRTHDEESDRQFTDTIREEARAITKTADAESRRMLSMLRDVLRPLRAIEGRKTVLFFSEGFNGDDITRDLEQVAAAASQSYSVIDAIDLSRRGLDPVIEQPTTTDRSVGIHDNMTPLGGLAAATSGRLILDAEGRLDRTFTAIADESQDYYLVGFAPRDESLKDRSAYRPVEVRIHRSGARISARTGVVLADPSAQLTRRDAIDRALAAPFAQQGLPIRYTTYVLGAGASGVQSVILSLESELPLSSLTSAAADVVFVVRSVADGHVTASGTDRMPLPATHAATSTSGTGAYRVRFDVPAGEYVMRVVVREPGGLVGSADRPFTIRALDGPALTSGDLIVSSVRGELPVRPTAYVGDGLSGTIELYGRTPDQLGAASVVVDLVPAGESAAIVSGTCDLQEVRKVAAGVVREAKLALPLDGVPAGAYFARARVMSGPDTVAEITRDVDIRPGGRPSSAATGEPSGPFDPREVVRGAFAREFAARLVDAGPPVGFEGTRGLARLAVSDYPSAIAAFHAVLDANPAPEKTVAGPAAFLLGWAYHGAGDDHQAISAWRRAAFIDPTIVPAHLALADAYAQLSQPALAIQALRAGLAALPRSSELLDRLRQLEQK